MKINHIAIWCHDLERLKQFYQHYFLACCNDKYINKSKGFSSYFLTLSEGARIELMSLESLQSRSEQPEQSFAGLAHIAFTLGSKQKVDEMTERLRLDGYKVVGKPRTTGDGYYESVVLDPEGNRLELVA